MAFNADETLTKAYEAILARRWSDVKPLAEQLYEHDPTNVEYVKMFASCFMHDESSIDYAEGLRLFDEAVALDPESEQISVGRCHCLLGLGRRDDAHLEVRRYTHLARWEMYKQFMPPEDEDFYRT
jgi:cytochrome c-type biogenesis protein CcmH/NrfG